jgi:hypothetical protein
VKQTSLEQRPFAARRNRAAERAPSRGYLRANACGKDAAAEAALESAATKPDASRRGLQAIVATERGEQRSALRRTRGRADDSATKSSVFHKAQGTPGTPEATPNYHHPEESRSFRLGVQQPSGTAAGEAAQVISCSRRSSLFA